MDTITRKKVASPRREYPWRFELNVDHGERRRNTRYAAALEEAWIGWWEEGRFVESPARLVNVSSGGALVEAEHAPRVRKSVWICLVAPERTGWVEGLVLDARNTPEGVRHVRIRFREVCPYAFLDLSVSGGSVRPATR